MHRHVRRASLSEGLHVLLRLEDHEVAVERPGGGALHCGDDRRAPGEIGDEAPVHHVDVDEVRAGGLDGADLVADAGQVAGQ